MLRKRKFETIPATICWNSFIFVGGKQIVELKFKKDDEQTIHCICDAVRESAVSGFM
jgi:hypothetical protein